MFYKFIYNILFSSCNYNKSMSI